MCLSRSQSYTSSALLERIPIPVQQTLARDGPVLACLARRNRGGPFPLSTSHGRANRIGREIPIPPACRFHHVWRQPGEGSGSQSTDEERSEPDCSGALARDRSRSRPGVAWSPERPPEAETDLGDRSRFRRENPAIGRSRLRFQLSPPPPHTRRLSLRVGAFLVRSAELPQGSVSDPSALVGAQSDRRNLRTRYPPPAWTGVAGVTVRWSLCAPYQSEAHQAQSEQQTCDGLGDGGRDAKTRADGPERGVE